MNQRRIGLLAGVASVVGIVLQFGPGLLLDRWINDTTPGWVPTFGSMGQTVVVYSYLTRIIGLLAVVILGAGLGYYASRRIDVADEYRQFGGTVALGSAAGVATVVVAMLVVGGSLGSGGFFGAVDGFSLFVLVATFLRLFVQVSVLITVCALAAAALVHFETSGGPPRGPTDSTAETPASEATDGRGDTPETQSQPT